MIEWGVRLLKPFLVLITRFRLSKGVSALLSPISFLNLLVPVFLCLRIRNMPLLAFGIHNEQYDCDMVYNMRVIIVGTETTQGFTVGIATQVPSGRVWETQPVRRHVGHPGDTVSRIVLYAGKNP